MITGITAVPVQGEDLLLKVSDDNGENWYTILCLIKQGHEFDRQINKTNTQCGQLIGKTTPDRTIPLEGAINVTEDEVINNEGFASYKKMQQWAESFTSLLVKQNHPDNDATSFKHEGPAYLTSLKMDAPVDNICTFTATLTGWGVWAVA